MLFGKLFFFFLAESYILILIDEGVSQYANIFTP